MLQELSPFLSFAIQMVSSGLKGTPPQSRVLGNQRSLLRPWFQKSKEGPLPNSPDSWLASHAEHIKGARVSKATRGVPHQDTVIEHNPVFLL